jgi:hypothetical protein
MSTELPTKPGPYYWREKDGDEWALGNVFESYDCREQCLYFETFNISGKPLNDMQGQWLPIPTPDELVELQAKAKAYDEGREQWQIWDPCHSKLEMIGQTESEAITAFRHSIVSNNPPEPWSQYLAAGYTCSKVRVCKEVENEKGTE